ncbi:HdeD family acid-resistance protein [Roseicitreum antarcticum]|jgi:uncharacterized membrane protein HdeD (DUF308 family)|uniref:Uncharacterized membrane protein HdeD, DUF308 family n=1 Tax=Roseicitreum antarcticum TaxID=564137 RepID=A0A1H3EL35_9RHOB|nr:HdeD family acid-resistance protein [Roseicitreum antarcticum]SDX79486.1 Uncharacterized membrane protein HdeD, DUF308 family [Roseicitreum antarcticum]
MDDLTGFLQRNWWLFLLRGVAAIVFGIAAFVWPGLTLTMLIALFGAYVLIDGIFGLVQSIRDRNRLSLWWLWALEGILGIVVGVLTFVAPGVTAFILLMFIAAWAIVGGALRIVMAIRLRREIHGEWFLVAGGVMSVLFGVLLFIVPGAGILSIIWIIGMYSIVFGVLFIALSLRLRREKPARVSA